MVLQDQVDLTDDVAVPKSDELKVNLLGGVLPKQRRLLCQLSKLL